MSGCYKYLVLYNIVHHKSKTIFTVMESSPANVMFRRYLSGPRLVSWNSLLLHLSNVHLQNEPNEFRLNIHENGKFCVDSMYNELIQLEVPVENNNKLWKLKIPLKIKVLTWYLRKEIILTKGNLAKQDWHGSKKYVFCHLDETIKNLFFQYRFLDL
jgi:hypothetical protein